MKSIIHHTSDIHISFDKAGKILKRMDERGWSIGTTAYVGYIEKLLAYQSSIASDDLNIITGDVTHNMKGDAFYTQLEWISRNFKGHIVLCAGNHDVYGPTVPEMRLRGLPSNITFIDSGEVITIGRYTIGCYSKHEKKCEHEAMDQTPMLADYLRIANLTVARAKELGTTPIMISHYPLQPILASDVALTGIKAYLSGHVHITQNKNLTRWADYNEPWENNPAPGVDLEWYNKTAWFTNDKVINNCRFSTGTTDVQLYTHGDVYKKIILGEEARTIPVKDPKKRAAEIFKTHPGMISHFNKEDPFNPGMTLEGYLCREKGPFIGSMYISSINGEPSDQVVYGTPKLHYPYTGHGSRDLIEFNDPRIKDVLFVNKYNGVNIFLYCYRFNGEIFLTAKTKGTPFVTDTEVGNFKSLLMSIWDRQYMNGIKAVTLEKCGLSGMSGLSCEMYGKLEPHLVKYDCDLALAPLFEVYGPNEIAPALNFIGPAESRHVEVPDIKLHIRGTQVLDYAENESFRYTNKLPLKYEYEHFATEGAVLYCLDKDGYVVDGKMYKVKPKDIEEVHWATFTNDIQGRVLDAVKKLKRDGLEVTTEAVASELDMGPKELDKWEHDISVYLKNLKAATSHVVVLCGLPGAGKSFLCKEFYEPRGYVRISQDVLGSRNKCKDLMKQALKEGKNVVVDRVNFDVRQRQSWVELAKKAGVTKLDCVILEVPAETSVKRMSTREGHETIGPGADYQRIADQFSKAWAEPTEAEGFRKVVKSVTDDHYSIEDTLNVLKSLEVE